MVYSFIFRMKKDFAYNRELKAAVAIKKIGWTNDITEIHKGSVSKYLFGVKNVECADLRRWSGTRGQTHSTALETVARALRIAARTLIVSLVGLVLRSRELSTLSYKLILPTLAYTIAQWARTMLFAHEEIF